MPEIVKFLLFPNNSRLYLEVEIYENRNHMYASNPEHIPDYEGMFIGMEIITIPGGDEGKARLHPNYGKVLLHREALSIYIVSHEILHASIGWARRTRKMKKLKDDVDDAEERLAEVHSNMLANFCYAAKHFGLDHHLYNFDQGGGMS